MKRIIYSLLLAVPFSMQGQTDGLYVGPDETVTVLEGTDVFFAGVVADNSGTPGTLDIQASGSITDCVIDGEVTGDDRISFGDATLLTFNNGTLDLSWNSPAENNEILFTLLIESGGLVNVPPGNSLTTSNQLVLEGPGTRLVLLADATGYGQLLTLGNSSPIFNPLNAEIEAQQYLTSLATPGWRQLSFPVSATLDQLTDDLTLINASNGANANQYNIFSYDASPIGNYSPPGGTAGGTDATENTNTTYSIANAVHWTVAPGDFSGTNTTAIGPGNNAQAYNIYSGGSFPVLDGTTPGLIDITGETIGNGDYTFDCYTTHDYVFTAGEFPLSVDETQITGWNNIPNPYPSNLDVSLILADADFQAEFDYAAIHVWSPAGGDADLKQYRAITDNVETFVDWNTGGGKIGETQNIAPFQSFWVKTERDPSTGSTTGPDATFTLKNSMRSIEDNANFFKTVPPLIRLNVVEENTTDVNIDQAILAFDPLSTEGVDRNDAVKFVSPNEDVPSIYTKIDNARYTINRLPNPDPAYSIPLFMDSKKNGQFYSMRMVDENIDPNWTIHLEDVKTGKMHNLRHSNYDFNHDAGLKGNRFVVHINKMPGLADPNTWNNVTIYSNDAGINVAFANPEQAYADIVISNLSGQVVYQGTVSTGRLFTYQTNEDIAVYAIQVVTGKKVTNEKVVK